MLQDQVKDPAYAPRAGIVVHEDRSYKFNMRCRSCGHRESPHDCPACGCGGNVFIQQMSSAIQDEPCACPRCLRLQGKATDELVLQLGIAPGEIVSIVVRENGHREINLKSRCPTCDGRGEIQPSMECYECKGTKTEAHRFSWLKPLVEERK